MVGKREGCDGKKQFRTYWQAERAMRKLNKYIEGARTNVYKCPGTHHFHLGNTMGNKRRRREQTHGRI